MTSVSQGFIHPRGNSGEAGGCCQQDASIKNNKGLTPAHMRALSETRGSDRTSRYASPRALRRKALEASARPSRAVSEGISP